MPRMKALITVAAIVLAAPAAGFLSGCQTYKNPHGRQNLPHVIRIVSDPAEAKLRLVRQNLILYTPADIELEIKSGDTLEITKKGYLPFRGTLRDMPQIALNTYQVTLQKAKE